MASPPAPLEATEADRRAARIPMDLETARRLLAPLVAPGDVESVEPLSGGLVNSNYKVRIRTSWEPLVLRLYGRGKAIAEAEARIYRLLSEQVPAPALLYDGTTRQEPAPYLVQSFVPGIPLSRALSLAGNQEVDLRAIGQAVGRALARIHDFRFEAFGFIGETLTPDPPHTDGLALWSGWMREWLQGRAGERLGQARTKALGALIERAAPLLARHVQQAVLVHSDYKAENILLVPEDHGWRVSGVIDWEFAFAGPAINDFGNLFRLDSAAPPAFRDGVLSSYAETHGAGPDGILEAAELWDLSAAVEAVSGDLKRPRVEAFVRDWIDRVLAKEIV